MTEPTDQPARPLRADAERNRQAIICAAGRVFADEGTAVTLEHIADVAGVGVGTIYRRFSTIDEIVTVVMEAKMARYADRAEAAAELAITDASAAFREYVFFILDEQAADLAFSELILSPRGASALFRSEIGRALDATLLLVGRAIEAGAVRADFDHSDLYVMLNASAGIARGVGRALPGSVERFGHYMLQAFTAPGTDPLPPPPRGWSRAAAARSTTS